MASAIEVIAGALVIVSLLKVLIVLTNRQKWMSVVKSLTKNPKISKAIMILLALIVFYFLIQEVSIVTIFAVMAFISLLTAAEMMDFPDDVLNIARKALQRDITSSMLIYTLAWSALIVWAFIEIFFL